jgi:hypothetical protein
MSRTLTGIRNEHPVYGLLADQNAYLVIAKSKKGDRYVHERLLRIYILGYGIVVTDVE